MKIFSAVFALLMGLIMLIVWTVLIATGQHDFQTAPYESASLLAAEAVTALALLIGGAALLSRKKWGLSIHLASLGMMLYTSVNSIGVFAQAGVIPASIFFTVLTVVTILLVLMWTMRALRDRQAVPAVPGEIT